MDDHKQLFALSPIANIFSNQLSDSRKSLTPIGLKFGDLKTLCNSAEKRALLIDGQKAKNKNLDLLGVTS